MTSLNKMLKKYDENGKHASVGKWSIGRGGYDCWFEVYYNNEAVAQCVDGEVAFDFAAFRRLSKKMRQDLINALFVWDSKLKFDTETSDIICYKKTWNITQAAGRCPENCKYSAENNDGICGAECLECGGTLFYTTNKKTYCDGECGFEVAD